MRSQLLPRRLRGNSKSLHTVPPAPSSPEYSPALAAAAAQLLYRSPLPSAADLPVYILDAAAFPDTREIDYDQLLPYVLGRLPDEEALIGGRGYEIVFFAGDGAACTSTTSPASPSGRGSGKPGRPSWTWIINAYHALPRALRKRLQKLYLVHERRWVRVAAEMFAAVVSPKVRHKVAHAGTLSALALHIPLEDLLVPPAAYAFDRTRSPDVFAPYASGRRAFGAGRPLPLSAESGEPRLPRVLREASAFVLAPASISAEGLFRINARATTLDVLREAFDRGQKFVLWKEEGRATMLFPAYREGHGDVFIEEPEVVDGYGLNAAAGLIKLWYAELREPVFPEAAYPFLERVFGDATKPIEARELVDLLLPDAEWSPVPRPARAVLTTHLLPLLSLVARADGNRMDAHNLATCFAPTLLRSADPIEDVKAAPTVTRILAAAIQHWIKSDLAALCGMNDDKFQGLLRTPTDPADREDPLDLPRAAPAAAGQHHGPQQTEGILLLDDGHSGSSDGEEDAPPPPLPPRVGSELASPPSLANTHPPRYSTVMTAEPQGTREPSSLDGLRLDTDVQAQADGTGGRHRANTAGGSVSPMTRASIMSTAQVSIETLGASTPLTASIIARKPLPVQSPAHTTS